MRKFLATTAVAGAMALPIAPHPAIASDLTPVMLVHGLPQLSASFAIASSLPAYLGYWEEEGLDVEVNTTPGTAAAMQLVLGGQALLGYGNPNSAMVARQRGGDLGFYYTSLRGDIFGIGLPAGSGMDSLDDLRGRSLGVSSFASGGTPYARALLRDNGLDPETDVTLVEVGVGGRAAAALTSDQIQAYSLWDEAYARLEQAGIEIAHVIKDPRAENFIAGSLVVRDSTLESDRDILVGVARGIAKAQIFQETNPEAAVRIHWTVYPQTAPREGITDETVAREAEVTVVRREIQSRDVFGTGRFGDMPRDRLESFQQYLFDSGQIETLMDVSEYHTDALIDEINDFDHDAIVEQALNFTFD